MKWKSYYRNEFDAPGTRDYLDAVFSEAEKDASLDVLIDTGSILSFPHTALHYAASQHARVIVSMYRAAVEQVITLGVLHLWGHPASSSLYRRAMDFAEEAPVRQEAFSALAGAFIQMDPRMHTPFGDMAFDLGAIPESDVVRRDEREFLAEEFSLDTFFSLLHYYYLLHDRPLPRIVPLYIGMTRNPVTDSFVVAEKIGAAVRSMMTTKTAIVATGDVTHYGFGYSLPEVMDAMPRDVADLKRSLYDELERVLDMVIIKRDYQRAFPRLDKFLNNDQRYLLPVIAEILNKKVHYNIISFRLSDYSSINGMGAPCVVASSLVAYGPVNHLKGKKEHE